jgi:peptide-methionine (R)-S-oxide reductase
MKIHKPEEWKNILTPEQYAILVEKGTERAFTGTYDQHFEDGAYLCGACGAKLFESQNKYDAGCGWPSFDQTIPGSVEFHDDDTLGMRRTEVVCAACGGHLGHVFPDGPKETTGQRFCINSVSLNFKKGS